MPLRMDCNAASPAGMKALDSVYGHIMQSGLPKALVDLVFLRASQNQRLRLLHRHAFARAVEGGHNGRKACAGPGLARGRCAVRRHRARSARLGGDGDAHCRNGRARCEYEAAAAVFDRKQLADLTIAIGLINAYNRVAISFRATPEAAKQ